MSQNTRILIVDDEVLIADYLQGLLEDESYSQTQTAYSCEEARATFAKFQPEIVLMDINIDGPDSGIFLADEMKSHAGIIYVTAQNDGATIKKAIGTQPENYLTKPVKKADLLAALQLAIAKRTKSYLMVRDGHDEVRIERADILFVKSDDVYIDVVTLQRKYTLRKSLDGFLAELADPQFCKVHRSYIVNKKHINQKSSGYVLVGDAKIPLSRNLKLDL